jgi:acyl-CoA thioesterase
MTRHYLPKAASLEQVRAVFERDRFAMGLCGIEVDEASYGHVVCSMDIKEHHLNGNDVVMGGAVFTLGDFALGIISNLGEPPSVSANCEIAYLNAAKGQKLIATARCDKSGANLGFYTVDIEDETGKPIARLTGTVFRRS